MTIELIAPNGTAMQVESTQVEAMLAAGFTRPAPVAARPAVQAAKAKQRISKSEAVALSDKNLAESFGLPSELAAQPVGFSFKVKVEDFISQVSRRHGGLFPSTQVSYNGTKFCILFDQAHEVGAELSCKLEESDATRTGKTVVVA